MPAPTDELIYTPTRPAVRISMEPAFSAIFSLMLLAKPEKYSELGQWVFRTALSMSSQERQRHNLVLIGFYYAVTPARTWLSFPDYLQFLEEVDPQVLIDQMLLTYALHQPGGLAQLASQPAQEAKLKAVKQKALASEQAYLDFLRGQFGADHIDAEIESQAYQFLMDPPAMQNLITAHLRFMWDHYLAAEWQRAEPLLRKATQALNGMDTQAMSRAELCRAVTGQDLPDTPLKHLCETSPQVVFVPNLHAGSYLGWCQTALSGDTVWIFYRPPLPRAAELKESELSRAEIIVRLSALADDSRLQIMEYIAAHGEVRSQQLIQALGMSQSTASRHLRQLSAVGYLVERRCDGAKCYAINSEQIEQSLKSISGYLQGRSESH